MTHQLIKPKYRNLADFIEDSLEKYADKPAFSCLGQTLTFAEMEAKSRAMASWFQKQNQISPGDRIVIQLPNLNQYPIAAYAALRAGLVIVNTNPLYTSREMLHQFKDSGAKAIIILDELLPKLNEIKDDTDIEIIITTSVSDLISKTLSVEPGCYSFKQILEENKGEKLSRRQLVSARDICVLQYTGGTTGLSKGACLSHTNLMANAEQTRLRLGTKCREAEEIFICPLPLYHIYAFTINMILFASSGNLNVLIPNPRDIKSFVNAIKPFKFTGMSGINTLFVTLSNNADFKGLDFSHFHLTTSGGTALTTAAAEIWKSVTGCSIAEGYGLSETSPVLCFNEPGKESLGTVGKPVEGTEIQFWDENDNPVAEGQIVVRGPQVMNCYWNMPDETTHVLTEGGFFKTGDVGLRLADGSIKIIDRLKDMIIVSGFNVYPNEIEDILTQHNAITEAAVIGQPDIISGEKVCAYLSTSSEISQEEVVEHCKNLLTAYKVPKKIVFMAELPKSSVGKILRRKLR